MGIILAPAPALIAYPDDFRARLREKFWASILHISLSVTQWALLGTGTTFPRTDGPFRAGEDQLTPRRDLPRTGRSPPNLAMSVLWRKPCQAFARATSASGDPSEDPFPLLPRIPRTL